MLLDGRVAVVSGVGPGLGKHIALDLAREGCQVVVSARSDSTIASVAGEIEMSGGRALAVPADVTVRSDCDELAKKAREQFGRIDVLVVNGYIGTGRMDDFESADPESWRQVFDVNVWGAMNLIQAHIPHLRESTSGRIIITSAMATRVTTARGRTAYAASKAVLNQFIQNLAYELGPDGIRVNGVAPGWMAGPTVDALLAGDDDDEMAIRVRRALEDIPLGYMPPSSEVAKTFVYLASDLALPITGQCIDANGGHFMQS